MQKGFTDSLHRKLQAACLELCRVGHCRMGCEVEGAKLGFCKEAFERVDEKFSKKVENSRCNSS